MPAIDRDLMAEVSRVVAERMGLHFPEERWPDLGRGLASAARELGFAHPDATLSWLSIPELTTGQVETLASHLTVGETYFFRDPASFAALEQEILPALMAKRAGAGRILRLWSAGCCTGEEAYSLAITCSRAVPDLRAWNLSILATDINPKFLAKAEAGRYSEWSFRGTPAALRERFFSPAPDKSFVVAPTFKQLVHFSYLNLAEDLYPSLHNHTNAMDVVFCRNVLMYFTPDHQRRVVAALHRSLVDGGYLFVDPVEAGPSLFPMFVTDHIGGVIVFRKTSQSPGVEPPAALVSSAAPSALPWPEPALLVALPRPESIAPVAVAQPILPSLTSLQPDSLMLAQALANQGKLAEALVSCQKAIAARRTDPAAYLLCATICHELGQLDEAATALGKVLYLDQDSILAHHALGRLYRRLGKRRGSRRHLAIALALLSARTRDELVPESDGMTCGRLEESARALMGA